MEENRNFRPTKPRYNSQAVPCSCMDKGREQGSVARRRSVREMKSAIVVCATVFVWSAAVAFTPRGKDGDKFADVNVEEVCKDRCVRRLQAMEKCPPSCCCLARVNHSNIAASHVRAGPTQSTSGWRWITAGVWCAATGPGRPGTSGSPNSSAPRASPSTCTCRRATGRPTSREGANQ